MCDLSRHYCNCMTSE